MCAAAGEAREKRRKWGRPALGRQDFADCQTTNPARFFIRASLAALLRSSFCLRVFLVFFLLPLVYAAPHAPMQRFARTTQPASLDRGKYKESSDDSKRCL